MASFLSNFRFSKDDLTRLSSTRQPVTDNIVGTVLFLGYIVAALALTGLIASDLWLAFQMASTGESLSHGWFVAAIGMALISFVTLSRNMVGFLLGSYQAKSKDLKLGDLRSLSPSSTLSLGKWKGFIRDAKIWMLHSTLFQDFAEMITFTPARIAWTQRVLILTMVWHRSMAIEGRVPVILQHFTRSLIIA